MTVEHDVAVVTGAASGIGFALARRAAGRGMKVVLADVEEEALLRAADELRGEGATVLAVPTDVSRLDQVEALAAHTREAFGPIGVLCNNAGVNLTLTRPVWEYSPGDWEWVTGVNLWGVIHGLRAFLPAMLEQPRRSHILNTASIIALMTGAGAGLYKLTKHAVLSLSETLYHELRDAGARVGVSVLCPGLVDTRLREAARNRPAALRDERPRSAEERAAEQELRMGAIAPARVAEIAFEGIDADRLYVFTEPGAAELAAARARDMAAGSPGAGGATGS